MIKTVVYYEYERILGVNTTHDDANRVRHYNYFSSLSKFKIWIAYEMSNCQTVEITDKNYRELAQKGVI